VNDSTLTTHTQPADHQEVLIQTRTHQKCKYQSVGFRPLRTPPHT